MSKKQSLNNSQKKILQAIENGLSLAETKEVDLCFDFPCPNNDCPGKNGKRYNALAWKNKKQGFTTYCEVCGENLELDREEFKSLKKIFNHESSKKENKSENFPACIVGSPDYYEEEYLDDEEKY